MAVLVGALALAVRLHGLDAQSLFMDEILQVEFYHEGFVELAARAMLHQQPPLDYWIGHLVYGFAQSDFAVRLPAALFGAGTVVVLIGLIGEYTRVQVALFAGAVLALMPFHIFYSQEARPYAIAIFLFVLMMRVLQRTWQGAKPSVIRLSVLAVTCCLFLLSRTLSPLVVVTTLMGALTARLVVSRLFGRRWDDPMARHCRWSIAALGLGLLVSLPVFGLILRAGGRYAPTPTDWSPEVLVQGLSQVRLEPLVAAYVAQTEPMGLWLLLPTLLAPLAIGCTPRLRRLTIPWIMVGTLPAAMLLYGYVFYAKAYPPLRPAYLIFVLPGVLFLSALTFDGLLDRLPERAGKWVQGLAAAAAIAACSVSSLQLKSFHDKADWRGLARHLETEFGEHHLLLFDALVPPGIWDPENFGMERYYQGHSKQLALAKLPALLPPIAHFPVRPVLIIYRYRNRFLTARSKYPIHAVVSDAVGPDLTSLGSDPRLRLTTFSGFTVVSLEETLQGEQIPPGLGLDIARLLDIVASNLASPGREPRPGLDDLYEALSAARALSG